MQPTLAGNFPAPSIAAFQVPTAGGPLITGKFPREKLSFAGFELSFAGIEVAIDGAGLSFAGMGKRRAGMRSSSGGIGLRSAGTGLSQRGVAVARSTFSAGGGNNQDAKRQACAARG